jgi:hypothetical protein
VTGPLGGPIGAQSLMSPSGMAGLGGLGGVGGVKGSDPLKARQSKWVDEEDDTWQDAPAVSAGLGRPDPEPERSYWYGQEGRAQ